jgi:hypothetical protein
MQGGVMAQFRILSLDGGGSWALIEAMSLIDLYGPDTTGHELLGQFDLAVANSGGSIVLGCLVENMKLRDILAFFLSIEKRESVFVAKVPHIPDTPKYKAASKLTGLLAALPARGGKLLPDAAADIPSRSGAPIHLLIIGFDYDGNCARFFRSASASGAAWGNGDLAQVRVADAIHASSNAPVLFFDKPAQFPTEPGKRYWDGAISGCNNPVLAGVTEAIVLGAKPDSIAALSLGTGTVTLPPAPRDAPAEVFFAAPDDPGLLHDVQKLAGAIVDDPPDAASFLAHVFTGGPPALPKPVDSRIVRMSPMISPVRDDAGNWALPPGLDEHAFHAVATLAMDAVAQDQVTAIQNLAAAWQRGTVRNQPVRMDGDFNAEIGHNWYGAAKEAWELLVGSA